MATLGHLLPPSAVVLLACAGALPGLALLNAWPGVSVIMPKHAAATPAGARRWAQIAAVVGQAAMPALAALYGGNVLDVPTCAQLRTEKRARWLRQRFDQLGAAGLNKTQAVQQLGIELAQMGSAGGAGSGGHLMSYRAIEISLDTPDLTNAELALRQARKAAGQRAADSRQTSLFTDVIA